MNTVAQSPLQIRAATTDDRAAVVELLRAAMNRADDPRFEQLLDWKHEMNPFGRSPAWVAVDGQRVVGYRAFLRWAFTEGTARYRAVRAVDTATAPSHQGRGVFRALTMRGLEEMQADGVDFVFNTPNDNSRPGYLKMGWQRLGVLRPRIRLSGAGSLPAVFEGRTPADHWGEPCDVGEPASEAFADDDATAALLASSHAASGRLATARSGPYLRWRYDTDLLRYRVLLLGADLGEGAVCFRIRRRGRAREAMIGDVFAPAGASAARRRLVSTVLKRTRADYAILLGGTWREAAVPVPGQGPTLVWRALCTEQRPPLERGALTMGDVELF